MCCCNDGLTIFVKTDILSHTDIFGNKHNYYIKEAYSFTVDGRVITIKIPKVIKLASGEVYHTVNVGDTISVQYYALDKSLDNNSTYIGASRTATVIDTGKVTADGARIMLVDYPKGDTDRTTYHFAAGFGWYGKGYYTAITTEDIPRSLDVLPGVVSGYTRISDVYSNDGRRYSPISVSNYYLPGATLTALYDGAEPVENISIDSLYMITANGEKEYLPLSAKDRLSIKAVEFKITNYNNQANFTALEFDEYAAEGKTDYVCVDVSDGGDLDLTHVYVDGAGELSSDKYRREGSLLLFSKKDIDIGKRINVLFGASDTESLSSDMNEHDSTSFVFGDKLYILDGKNYLVYDGKEVAPVMNNAYIPTTYINIVVGGENADAGAEFEARNMLSPYFKHTFIPDAVTRTYYMNEKDLDGIYEVKVNGEQLAEGEHFTVDLEEGKIEFIDPPAPIIDADPEKVEGTAGIKYDKSSTGSYYVCTGAGAAKGDIVISNYVSPYSKDIPVREIAERAFYNNTDVTKITVPEGISKIGQMAFFVTPNLEQISLPESLLSIPFAAFEYSGLTSVTIPKRVRYVSTFAFSGAKNLETVTFEGVPSSLSGNAFTGCDSLSTINVAWQKGEVPGEPWGAPEGVKINYGTGATSTMTESIVEITAEKGVYPAIDGNGEMVGEEFRSLIEQATIATVFDNRVFFSGIPARPNFLFWSSLKNPSYIGILNYQQDGIGTSPITAMVPVANTLLVLKSDTEDGGAVFYHTPVESGIDVMAKSYPSEEGLAGIGCLGAACNFLDDPVFISRLGLEAVGKLNLSYERSKEHRSSLIDAKLVNLKDLASAKLCEWSGYLVLLVDGKIFLADSRQSYADSTGIAQYEWYYLEDIGVYKDQYKRYEYLREYPRLLMDGDTRREITVTYAEREYAAKLISDVLPDVDITEVDPKTDKVIAQVEVDGISFEIVAAMYELNGTYHACLCNTADEMIGGTFCPAVIIKTIDDNLFFGTTNGVVCSFNFDKRGSDGAIPADYYTFDGRRIYSGCALKMDNCGVPHMTKTTVKKSTVVKAKSFMRTAAKIRVRTNKNPFNEIARITGTRFSFDDMDFSDFSFVVGEDTLFAIREKEKKWVEKQYYVYSDEYKKPFALYYLAYKYYVAGKYKG